MPFLSRASLMPVALFAAGALSVIGYGYVTRDSGATSPTQAGHQRATSGRALSGEPARLFQADANVGTPEAARAENDDSGAQTDGSTVEASAGTAGDRPAAPNGQLALAATPENVATWITQATGSDASRRAAAIEALGTAPKADAVPVLAHVLETADDADRPRALRSLRTLAQTQGDTDDRIRSVVRKIIFHADDEASTQAAQAMLDEIDRDLSQPRPDKR